MQLWAAKVFGLCILHLSMYNRPEVAHIHELVQGDLFGLLVLYVAHSTVGERVPLYLELAKDTLDLSHDLLGNVGNSC